jgi:hypothetical protein
VINICGTDRTAPRSLQPIAMHCTSFIIERVWSLVFFAIRFFES